MAEVVAGALLTRVAGSVTECVSISVNNVLGNLLNLKVSTFYAHGTLA